MMKNTIKYLCLALTIIVTLSACGSSSDKKQTEQHVDLPVKLETVSLNIEGMTCEIGCAKTIESKISKVEGVTESKVDFETKTGIFTYDANKTSEKGIVNTINGLLNGKTYKASKEKTCCTAKEVTPCTDACAEKCGHKVGENCEKCSSTKELSCATDKSKNCDKKGAEKCGHREGDESAKCSEKKDSCCATDKSKTCSEKKDVECTSAEKKSCESNSEKSCCKDKK